MKNLLIFAVVLVALLLVLQACSTQQKCDYDSETKKYVGKSADECSRIKFACEKNMQYFDDECGCGCEQKNITKQDCTSELRKGDACIALYQPVCGWFDPEEIQCFRYPCAQNYGNSCEACHNKNVVYWTDGECPNSRSH